MAAICAGRCRLSYIRSNPRALYTYGSPRVGNRRYVNYVQLEAYRWVNNNDIVTRVPPSWLGYRHKGEGNLSKRLRKDPATNHVGSESKTAGAVLPAACEKAESISLTTIQSATT